MTLPYEGMKAVLYARVSTEDHHEDASENRQNPESQLLALSKYCKENGIEIVGKYADKQTGSNMDRPEFDRMLGRILRGGVQIVLALDADRISRNMEDKNAFLKIIKPLGVVVRYIQDSTKPETEEGYLLDNMKTYGAQKYISGHTLKIKAGQERARVQGTKSGKPIGRPTAVISMDLVMECADSGYSLNKTASVMGVGRETLRRHLANAGKIEEFYRRTKNHILNSKTNKHEFLDNSWDCSKTPLPENTDCLYTNGKKRGGAE